jgi:hypothetical protein
MNHTIPVSNAPSPCDEDKLRQIFAVRDGHSSALVGKVRAVLPDFSFVVPGHVIPSDIDLTGWGLFVRVPSPKADRLVVHRSPSD